jgi:hypothetical protein
MSAKFVNENNYPDATHLSVYAWILSIKRHFKRKLTAL